MICPSWFQMSGSAADTGGEGVDLTPPRLSATGKLSSRSLALKTGCCRPGTWRFTISETWLKISNTRMRPSLSLPFIPSCLPMPANLCRGMRMSAASTSPQRGIDRIRAGVVRTRGVRNDDADRRPWARKRPFRTRPAERVVHPVCPCRSTGGSLNRDNSRGMSQECAANAAR